MKKATLSKCKYIFLMILVGSHSAYSTTTYTMLHNWTNEAAVFKVTAETTKGKQLKSQNISINAGDKLFVDFYKGFMADKIERHDKINQVTAIVIVDDKEVARKTGVIQKNMQPSDITFSYINDSCEVEIHQGIIISEYIKAKVTGMISSIRQKISQYSNSSNAGIEDNDSDDDMMIFERQPDYKPSI